MKTKVKVFLFMFIFLLAGCNFPSLVYSETPYPTITPIVFPTITPSPTLTPAPTPIPMPTEMPVPTITPTFDGTYTVQPGDTLGAIAARFGMPYGYLADKNDIENPNVIYPDQVLVIPVWPPDPATNDGKLIVVILSEQAVYVYEKGVLLKVFIVSTGTDAHPTVLGHFEILTKYNYYTMSGDDYYLPDVPWTMFFYQGYSFHGTYWHHNFGHPMSHGCVNMYTPDAEWLFNWANVGTPVWVYN